MKEKDLQINCVNIFNLQYKSKSLLLHHSPNENPKGLSSIQAINYNYLMKKMGRLTGFPDIIIVNLKTTKTLFIELKARKNKVKEGSNQRNVIDTLNSYNQCCFVCYTVENFCDIIDNYFQFT